MDSIENNENSSPRGGTGNSLSRGADRNNPQMPLQNDTGINIAKSTPLGAVRRLTKNRMLQSHLNSASVTVLAEADASELMALRKRINAILKSNNRERLSFTPLFVKIAADALAKHPEINSTLNGDELLEFEEININLALARPDGNLLAPVIRNADRLSVMEIASRISDLIDRAGCKQLKPADMQGGTFTVTNGGMFPAIRWTTPLVNIPQCAILGLGSIALTPVVVNGKIEARPLVALSLTFDHQVVNGFPASAFLQSVADLVADPSGIDTGI